MEALISTFHIDWKLMIAQIINFVLVFIAIYFIAAKPLKKLMDERTNEISTGLLNAKSNAEILSNTKKEYEEVILKARKEASVIFESGKKEAEEEKAVMIEKAKDQVAKMIEDGKKSLLAEKTKMVDEAKKEIISLVIQSTEKIVGNKVDEQVIKRELGAL